MSDSYFDFGGYGGDYGGGNVSILGQPDIFSVGGSFFEPTAYATNFADIGGFNTDFNSYIADQTPLLALPFNTSLPFTPEVEQLQSQAPLLVSQQEQIKTLANDINKNTDALKSSFENYQKVYNDNIGKYNSTMDTYKQYIRYRDQTAQGSYLWNRHNSNANEKLNEANQYVVPINNAAQQYQTQNQTYQNQVQELQNNVSTYNSAFNDYAKAVENVPKEVIPETIKLTEPSTDAATDDATRLAQMLKEFGNPTDISQNPSIQVAGTPNVSIGSPTIDDTNVPLIPSNLQNTPYLDPSLIDVAPEGVTIATPKEDFSPNTPVEQVSPELDPNAYQPNLNAGELTVEGTKPYVPFEENFPVQPVVTKPTDIANALKNPDTLKVNTKILTPQEQAIKDLQTNQQKTNLANMLRGTQMAQTALPAIYKQANPFNFGQQTQPVQDTETLAKLLRTA